MNNDDMKRSIWIGFDPREADAYAVCRDSIIRRLTLPIPVHGLILQDLQKRGLYTRAVIKQDGQMFDPISDAPMSTEFAITRFFVPMLADTGWALFMDCDMLVRVSMTKLFEQLDPKYAVYCVKHDYTPDEAVKMDNQKQTKYPRKNWSSFCVFNCDHPANRALTKEMLNSLPGRDLHRFSWLEDKDIGELGIEWNFLVDTELPNIWPNVLHFTKGGPWMDGYRDVEFADEWCEAMRAWAR